MANTTEADLRSHRECMQALGELEACLKTAESCEAGAVRLGECLERFSIALRRHFEHEERGNFYVELPTRKPRLADRIAACRAEHLTLLGAVDAIRAEAVGAADDAARRAIALRAVALVERVRRHEADEAELMQIAVLREVGAGD